jgi:hypothetical protein
MRGRSTLTRPTAPRHPRVIGGSRLRRVSAGASLVGSVWWRGCARGIGSVTARRFESVRGTPSSPGYPVGNGECRNVPVAAACCSIPIRGLCSGFGRLERDQRHSRTAMVRKGSPVRVRQRALRSRATARFSRFRSGSADPFLTLPSENGSGMAAGRRCAAGGGPRSASRSRPKLPTRYTPGARFGCDAWRAVGAAFAADHRGLRWRAGRAPSRVGS